MSDEPRVVVVVLTSSPSDPRPAALLRWIRYLLPAALLIVSGSPTLPNDASEVITLSADAVESSPLAVADAIVKALGGR
ncbi:MAG TPA: hypothetical protein VFG59_20275 [Anaeromyxobacter sp.]|nr:hypothetical protein [Anaeromyxobacter sp.]